MIDNTSPGPIRYLASSGESLGCIVGVPEVFAIGAAEVCVIGAAAGRSWAVITSPPKIGLNNKTDPMTIRSAQPEDCT
jgi:hypothetical protein